MKQTILILGIIFLLIGVSIIPSTAINMLINKSTMEEDIDWWPMFHHDLNHTGFSTSTGPETNNVLWAYQADDIIESSSPAIVHNRIFFGDNSNFYCLDSDTGEQIWKKSIPSGIGMSSPAVENGKVYFGASVGNGDIYCLNVSTGDIIWKYQTPGISDVYSPAVYDGKVFIGAHDPSPGCMYCLDADTGEEIWIFQNIDSPGSPALSNDRIYFGSQDFNVYCLYADNGTKIWTYKTEGKNTYSIRITIYDDKIYAGGDDGLYCLDIDEGDLVWKYPTDDRIYSTPCTANGYVYFAPDDPQLFCLDADSGEKIWDFETRIPIKSSPAYADGKIYIACGIVYCLDADSGEKIWDFVTTSGVISSPVIANGKVYIGSRDDGEMLCFGGESDNKPPCTPERIFGPTTVTIDVECTFNTSTYDPDGDQLYYKWVWELDESGWLGPFNSNETVEININFYYEGTNSLKVIVKDSNHARSDWAELEVRVPRDKTLESTIFFRFLERYPLLNLLLQKLII
ncbi:hypothetical protein AYK24_06850 [Thermoplasmatales archaeon SG8-52-4]|nr:MAG: hypothetical protein AYK24_06850 [Thermoplasmatales archaeon SG8-52-4]